MRSACRLCQRELPQQPFLALERMPSSAQGFLQEADIVHDVASELIIFQCSHCGLVQTNSPPVPYWREVIRATDVSDEMKKFRADFFEKFAAAHNLHSKSILEIGCGRGDYLKLLESAGVRPTGTEYGAENAEIARAAGYDVYQIFPDRETALIPGAPFAGFAVFNFMEHWPDPGSVLRAIRRNLSDDAVGLIEVPNFEKILSKKIFSEFIADHLTYFTKKTLALILSLNGFEIISCEPIWYDYILSAEVRLRKPLNPALFKEQTLLMREKFDDFFRNYDKQDTVIWGAGHQALATIAMFGLEKQVKYIVDSAKFKQGRYTPGTHIPIHAPDRLKEDPDKNIIIMAAGYSDEILKIIRGKFRHSGIVAILREDELDVQE